LRYGKHLAAPRTWDLFGGKKIIVREITGKYPNCIISTYSDEIYLYNRSNIAIIEKAESVVSLKYIVALLNSKLLSYYFLKNTAKSVRKIFPKIILNDLRKFPVKVIDHKSQEPFIFLAEKILDLNQRLLDISRKFITYLNSNINLHKPNSKLEKWYEITFSEFIIELNKNLLQNNKTPLSKKDEFEWMELFEENKKILADLKLQIDQIDKEIDGKVYQLYGLTEEEIKIVEDS